MSIEVQINAYRQGIEKAALNANRDPKDILLLAVSKKQTAEAIREAFAAGIDNFGESYWQEAREKQSELKDLPITWHFIGPIQSNKTKYIAKHFDWVHSVCREAIAEGLNHARPDDLPPLNVCIQVNIDSDPNKSGVVNQEELFKLVEIIQNLPKLKLHGLMTIPEKKPTTEETYQTFLNLKKWFDSLDSVLDTLSMGMTEDYKEAITAGSTCIRIGRGIFNGVTL